MQVFHPLYSMLYIVNLGLHNCGRSGHILQQKNVTRLYKTDPNRTSDKIKLTPPVDSYTIVLVVCTTQTTQGWFQQTSFLGGV